MLRVAELEGADFAAEPPVVSAVAHETSTAAAESEEGEGEEEEGKGASLQQAPRPQSFRVNLVIPTGAMGNIVAAYVSKLAGLPLGIIAAGVNANDVT